MSVVWHHGRRKDQRRIGVFGLRAIRIDRHDVNRIAGWAVHGVDADISAGGVIYHVEIRPGRIYGEIERGGGERFWFRRTRRQFAHGTAEREVLNKCRSQRAGEGEYADLIRTNRGSVQKLRRRIYRCPALPACAIGAHGCTVGQHAVLIPSVDNQRSGRDRLDV